MVVSLFAIYIDNSQNDIVYYGKQKFIITNDGYMTKINNTKFIMQYLPSEVERINLSQEITNKRNSSVYTVFLFDPNQDPNNLLYIDMIRYDLSTQMPRGTYFAITQTSENYSLPVLNCNNSTADLTFILINSSADTGFGIDKDNPNCIIMNAKYKELLASKDRIVYTMNNIMN